ncbi:MAG: hypothetical protein ACQEXB_04140 [Bacillota bacterium]
MTPVNINKGNTKGEQTRLPRPLNVLTPRMITGSLPLDFKVTEKGDEWLPAMVFSPPHLRMKEREPLLSPTLENREIDRLIADSPERKKVLRSTVLSTEATPFASMFEDSDQRFNQQSEAMLGDESDVLSSRFKANAADASYDFNEYILLRHPNDSLPTNTLGNGQKHLFPSDPQFQLLLNEAEKGIANFVEYVSLGFRKLPQMDILTASLRQTLYSWWFQVCAMRAYNQLLRYSQSEIKKQFSVSSSAEYYGQCLFYFLGSFNKKDAENFFSSNGDSTKISLLATASYWEEVFDGVFKEYFDLNGIPLVDPSVPDGEYPFDPYPADEVLFGLQVVNRQSWHLLGYGRGELVKTIPLGPKESQKVSVKIQTRKKMTRSSENSSSFETSADSSTTSKDTSEVVSEASEKMNMHAEAEISGGYGPFVQAKVSGGLAQDTATSSKDTKTRLNELMQKTASKMKRDTKVTVSSEIEQTFEETRSSELVNPNDEIAITYLYHQLQQRFWVSTEIAEVYSVVFVPEPIPAWDDITEDWLREHGDIIAGALLNPDFGPVLAAICKEPADLEYSDSTIFKLAVDAGIAAAGSYKNFTGGGEMPDLLASGQQAYERHYERENALKMEQARRTHQKNRLLVHIRRNILHYMRAIWSSEDYDQKMQRYSRMRVPTEWTFVPNGANSNPFEAEGVFMPVAESVRPLTEVINPIGPIGYLFNCAIYQLRDNPKLANLHQALAYLRSAYQRFEVAVTSSNPGLTVRQAVCYEPRSFSANYTLLYREQRGKWLVKTSIPDEMDWPVVNSLSNGILDILGFRIWLDGNPADGDTLDIRVKATGNLEDPHLRLIQMQNPLPASADEPLFFTKKLLQEMADIMPELSPSQGLIGWDELPEEEKSAFRENYHHYLMLRDTGRLVTLDTTNLVLDLEISQTPALEPFKRLHRYIDVKKEYEELKRRQLENQRRTELLNKSLLGDPEIERVSVISDSINKDLVAVLDQMDEMDTDTDPTGPNSDSITDENTEPNE